MWQPVKCSLLPSPSCRLTGKPRNPMTGVYLTEMKFWWLIWTVAGNSEHEYMTIGNFGMKNKIVSGLCCREKARLANIKSLISVIVWLTLGIKHHKSVQSIKIYNLKSVVHSFLRWFLGIERSFGTNAHNCLYTIQTTLTTNIFIIFKTSRCTFCVFPSRVHPLQEWQTPYNTNCIILWQIALIRWWSVFILTGTVSSVQWLKYPIRRTWCVLSRTDLMSTKIMICCDGYLIQRQEQLTHPQ